MKNQLAVVAMMTVTVLGGDAARRSRGARTSPRRRPRAPPPQESPKPPPENDVIKKSVGTWTCTATGKGPDGQEMKYKSTWTIKPTLGGHWYTITYKRSKMGPMPAFEGNATVGYNIAEKKYSFVGFDNLGGWINLSSPDGAVYTGQSGGHGQGDAGEVHLRPGQGQEGRGQRQAVRRDPGLRGQSARPRAARSSGRRSGPRSGSLHQEAADLHLLPAMASTPQWLNWVGTSALSRNARSVPRVTSGMPLEGDVGRVLLARARPPPGGSGSR